MPPSTAAVRHSMSVASLFIDLGQSVGTTKWFEIAIERRRSARDEVEAIGLRFAILFTGGQ